jgi:hypothetical protein
VAYIPAESLTIFSASSIEVNKLAQSITQELHVSTLSKLDHKDHAIFGTTAV